MPNMLSNEAAFPSPPISCCTAPTPCWKSGLLTNPVPKFDSVLCWSLIATDRYLEAEQRATEARKLNSYDTRLMEALGEAKYFLGKNNEALSMFQRFIANASETSKDIGLVYYYMGEIYVRQSRFQHADIAFSAAVRSAPTKDYWWTRLGYAREKTGDYKSALTAYEKALSLNASQYDAKNGKERCQKKL